MCHCGNDAQCLLQVGIALQGSSAMVFLTHLFSFLSPVPLFLSELFLGNYLFVSCVLAVGFKFIFFLMFYFQMYLLQFQNTV